MATAAKAKLLLRELKTVKADLAFAKERCAQLEEENKILRENRDKGDHRADDDLVFILFFFFSSVLFLFPRRLSMNSAYCFHFFSFPVVCKNNLC